MAKYRKKPVVIDAIRFTDSPDVLSYLSDFIGEKIAVDYTEPNNPVLKIDTLEGTMEASEGDYIIRGVQGEFYPCKPDIFEATYEAVK